MSLPSLPSSPHIVISYVSDASTAAVTSAGEEQKSFSARCEQAAGKNTVCIYVNKDRRTIVGIKILASGFRERHLLEAPVFSGDLAKYNRYEADVAWSHTFRRPFPLAEVGRHCGIPAGDKHKKNNVSKVAHINSFCRPVYGGENSKEVLQRFEDLVMTWIPA
jgi:hypothetical protein